MRNHIFSEMEIKSTEELTEIWIRNNRAEWTDEAFGVIKEILQDRLGEIPPQNTPAFQRPKETWLQMFSYLFNSSFDMETTRQHSKPTSRYEILKVWVGSILMGLMVMYLIYLAYYEWANGHQPDLDLAFWFMWIMTGGFFIWQGIELSWKTWFKPADFMDHLEKNVIPMQKRFTPAIFRWMVLTNLKFLLWNYRLMAPILVITGLFLLILSYSMWVYLYP